MNTRKTWIYLSAPSWVAFALKVGIDPKTTSA